MLKKDVMMVVGLGALCALIVTCMVPADISPEDRQSGRHCLYAFDGSHLELKRHVKDNLRDPDSFELIETYIMPLTAEKQHTIVMTYRAKNGFGGMEVAKTRATVDADCNIISILD